MPARSLCEYAVIRVMPRVERGECLNVGVILLCRQQRFLAAEIAYDDPRLAIFAPAIDQTMLQQQLHHIPLVCAGGTDAGAIGQLPIQERFRWLTAPRSTIIQTSPVHSALFDDPASALHHLFTRMVLPYD